MGGGEGGRGGGLSVLCGAAALFIWQKCISEKVWKRNQTCMKLKQHVIRQHQTAESSNSEVQKNSN